MVGSWSLEKEPDLKIVQYLVKPGDYVIDIGANIGVYSKVLSELVGQDGCVYSIEPFPSTFEILCYNFKKLRLENIKPINVAISDSEAVVTMVLPYDSSGAMTHYQAAIVKGHTNIGKTQMVNVQATTIDSKFLGVSKRVSFIKCDVEGHELACIRGAKNFLEQSQPVWLIEVSGEPDNANSAAHCVFEILSKKGYRAWWFDGTMLRMRRREEKSTNYFFLRDDHINILKSRVHELLLT
jgi:FkbM family methyltransferase